MIDIHSHILPGLDDGALSIDEALAMAAEAAEDGVHTIIATPHWNGEEGWPPKEVILDRTTQLATRIAAEGIPVRLLPGAEAHFCNDLLDRLQAGEVMTMADGGKFVLIELPWDSLPLAAEKLLPDLQASGYVPILAHPERNATLLADPSRMERLAALGVRLQLGASAVLGWDGRRAKKVTYRLIEGGHARYLATDAHGAGRGGPRLSDCAGRLKRLGGMAVVQQLCLVAPNEIIRSACPQRPKGVPENAGG